MKTILSYHVLLLCMLLPLLGSTQLILVTGSIINEKTGNALENVGILETYTGIGTISNMEGVFSLMLKPGKAEIVITGNGFKDFSQKIVLKNDTTLTVSLVPLINLKSKSKETEHLKIADKTERKK